MELWRLFVHCNSKFTPREATKTLKLIFNFVQQVRCSVTISFGFSTLYWMNFPTFRKKAQLAWMHVKRNCTLRLETIFGPVTSEHSPITTIAKPKESNKSKENMFLKFYQTFYEKLWSNWIIYLNNFIKNRTVWCLVYKCYTRTFSNILT